MIATRNLFILLTLVLGFLPARAEEKVETELLVVGGTESGWAAAIQAARMGVERIVMVHDGEWLGGQFTEQALVCVDENKGLGKVGWGVDWHPMKRSFHRSGLFKELMDRIEAFNTEKYGSPMPGNPYHGPSTFRPAEAEAIFREMLQPYLDSGQIQFFINRYPVRANVEDGKVLKGLHFAPVGKTQPDLEVAAKITIDASDWGEAIQVAGAAYECGPDPQSRYGEPSAPTDMSQSPHHEMNPITWAMIVEETDGDATIPRPATLDDRCFVRSTKESAKAMTGLEWDRPIKKSGGLLAWPTENIAKRQLSVYTVRRAVEGTTSKTGKTVILLNYMLGQDYPLERLPKRVADVLEATEKGASTKNIVEMTRAQRDLVFQDAKSHSLGLLHHLQTFVHDRAKDTTNSFRKFQLSGEFGTEDRLPPKPYIREGLRLKALYMMREQDGRNADAETKKGAIERFSRVMYPDGVGAWQFHYDFHRTGRAYLKEEGEDGPWIDYEKGQRHTQFLSDRCVFPMRSLIPEEMDGLLGAQKNVGYSSIVCAAIRLHDQCIAIGQASGATAAVALKAGEQARAIPYNRDLLEQVRDGLCGTGEGLPLILWPWRDLPADHEAFVAVNRLSMLGYLPIDEREVDFRPDDLAEPELIASTPLSLELPKEVTRGQFCQLLWQKLASAEHPSFERKSLTDADGDGILDRDDALPFTPNEPIVWEVEVPELTEETDGLPPKTSGKVINFGVANAKGVTNTGKTGWMPRVEGRKRTAMPESLRDSFVFTREKATFEMDIDAKRVRVLACVGDSGYEQSQQSVRLENQVAIDQVSTRRGAFHEAAAEIDVLDGKLTVEIGSGESGSNTCLCWLVVEEIK